MTLVEELALQEALLWQEPSSSENAAPERVTEQANGWEGWAVDKDPPGLNGSKNHMHYR